MKKALVPLADGFEDIEAVAIIDILRRGGVEVVTAALAPEPSALSAHGIRMETDALLEDVLDSHWDAIVLPGGGEGTANLMACEPLAEKLRFQKESGGLVCAICAAPTVLVAAGAAREGLHMTCYPSCSEELGRPYSDAPVVADGNLVTGQAPGSAVLFALVVLQMLAGEKVSRHVAYGMVTDVLE